MFKCPYCGCYLVWDDLWFEYYCPHCGYCESEDCFEDEFVVEFKDDYFRF